MSAPTPINVVIMGAAGRDFHDFNQCFRGDARYRVVAFTAAQIPDIDGRVYPPVLAGPGYPEGVPILPESDLPRLIADRAVRECVLSYSDLAYAEVMHKASIVGAAGADFRILGPAATMIRSTRPVVAVGAVRTGCGKSQVSRRVCEILESRGKRVAVVRHPMPYGDLGRQVCQRFASYEDLDRHACTIEEREEYEPHLERGAVVFAGVDYARILREAEREADVIVWDGGNNDLPFYRPDVFIVVADPLRPGHEVGYFPGETGARMAQFVLINKIGSARPEDVATVEANIRRINPGARILAADSPVTIDDGAMVRGKRVLVVEDGPTLTHGQMTYGAGRVAALRYGAAAIVDPRPFAVGSIRETYRQYPHLSDVLPAMGYGERQVAELAETLRGADADVVLIGTPIDLGRLLKIDKPAIRVRYELDPSATEPLRELLETV